jgi:hypothetical protein
VIMNNLWIGGHFGFILEICKVIVDASNGYYLCLKDLHTVH